MIRLKNIELLDEVGAGTDYRPTRSHVPDSILAKV